MLSTLCKKLCDLFLGETIFFTSLTDGNDNPLKYIYISNATRLAKQVNYSHH